MNGTDSTQQDTTATASDVETAEVPEGTEPQSPVTEETAPAEAPEASDELVLEEPVEEPAEPAAETEETTGGEPEETEAEVTEEAAEEPQAEAEGTESGDPEAEGDGTPEAGDGSEADGDAELATAEGDQPEGEGDGKDEPEIPPAAASTTETVPAPATGGRRQRTTYPVRGKDMDMLPQQPQMRKIKLAQSAAPFSVLVIQTETPWPSTGPADFGTRGTGAHRILVMDELPEGFTVGYCFPLKSARTGGWNGNWCIEAIAVREDDGSLTITKRADEELDPEVYAMEGMPEQLVIEDVIAIKHPVWRLGDDTARRVVLVTAPAEQAPATATPAEGEAQAEGEGGQDAQPEGEAKDGEAPAPQLETPPQPPVTAGSRGSRAGSARRDRPGRLRSSREGAGQPA